MRSAIKKMLATAAVAAVAVVGASVPASASGQFEWTKTINSLSPTLYQTNIWYQTAAFTAPATVSSSGVIAKTYHQWRVWDGPQGRGTLQVLACTSDLGKCTDITFTPSNTTYQGYPAYEADGWSTFFAGLPATTSFVYRYRLQAATTKVLATPIQSSYHRLSVDWDLP